MPTIRFISREEAQHTRKVKQPGIRKQRMSEFDVYVHQLIEHPNEALVFEDLGEPGQRFVMTLRGAFKRAGIPVTVRKARGRDEVRVWLTLPDISNPATLPDLSKPARAPRHRRPRPAEQIIAEAVERELVSA